jgi:D-tyrosyl-tRNA(Tyr) deacylase
MSAGQCSWYHNSLAAPDEAIPLYDAFVAALRARDVPVDTGEFGAMMDVALVNDGPVTLVMDR